MSKIGLEQNLELLWNGPGMDLEQLRSGSGTLGTVDFDTGYSMLDAGYLILFMNIVISPNPGTFSNRLSVFSYG